MNDDHETQEENTNNEALSETSQIDITNEEVTAEVDQDQKNLALMVWLGSVVLWFIPSLLAYLFKKEDAFVYEHAKEALNWVITASIVYFILKLLTVIFIGKLFLPILAVVHVVFCVIGVVKASNGESVVLPATLRLVK